MTYEEFKQLKPRVDALLAKQKAGTITDTEEQDLHRIMFGEAYMSSTDKGARKTYNA